MGVKKKTAGPLKIIRVLVATPLLVLFLVLFLDFTHSLPTFLYRWVEYFQFLPSLLKFINTLAAGVLGWFLVLLLTLLFGRIYCSFLCPLGVSFDVMTRLAPKKIKKLPPYKKRGFLRYGVLALFLVVTATGSMIAINLLDPYSNFGRLATDLLRPLIIGMNNLIAHLLEAADIYTLPPHDLRGYSVPAIVYGLLYLAGIVFLALRQGRLYCNTICPVGTLLGLLSRFSFFRVRILKGPCTACGACSRVCKASCIEHKSGDVDMSRCVVCMNCLDVCPEDAIVYKFRATSKDTESGEVSGEEEK